MRKPFVRIFASDDVGPMRILQNTKLNRGMARSKQYFGNQSLFASTIRIITLVSLPHIVCSNVIVQLSLSVISFIVYPI